MFDDRLDKARDALKKKREQKAKFINNSMDNLRITKSEQNPIITDLYDLCDDLQKRISFLTDLVEKYDVLLNGILGEIKNSPIKIISKICKIFLHRNLNADTH